MTTSTGWFQVWMTISISKTDDPTYTLQRYPEEELDNFRLASKWYKDGYIYKDAATEKKRMITWRKAKLPSIST
ncbi:hypothetical protein ACFTAO_36435 [Paenibacillus rhizoplanae]